MFKTLLATTLVGSALATDVVEDFSNPYVVCVLSLLNERTLQSFDTSLSVRRTNKLSIHTYSHPTINITGYMDTNR